MTLPSEEPPTPSEHYAQLGDVYRTLGEIDGWHCPGNRDFTGWYRTRDGTGRAWALGKEYTPLRRGLDRVLYATVNYAPARWFAGAWRSYEWVENSEGQRRRKWDGDTAPTPGYGDIRAYAPFADIDLSSDVKPGRPNGDIPREPIEEALSLYLEAFADLAGDARHVYALDSVGGAYVFVAPTSTAPIAEAFDRDARALIFGDMMDRLNEWLDDVRDDVNSRIQNAEGVFEPDLLNNKNRLYKAPLSIHSSLDGVVTPIDRVQPRYDYTPLDAVDDALIAEAEAWADGFTGDHRDAVASIVATLWPEHDAEADGWRDAVGGRIDHLEQQREVNRERELKRLTADDVPDDLEETDDLEMVNAAIERIDVRQVARDVADRYDTDPGRDPVRFKPPWRQSDSGTSCFVDRDKFVDLQEGSKGGGALTLVARATGIINDCGKSVKGTNSAGESRYWLAVNELRKLGYEIPYFSGTRGTHPDGLRLYEEPENQEEATRQALRAMHAARE